MSLALQFLLLLPTSAYLNSMFQSRDCVTADVGSRGWSLVTVGGIKPLLRAQGRQ